MILGLYLLFSAASAAITVWRLGWLSTPALGFVGFGTIWTLLQVLPVEAAAAVSLAGPFHSVSFATLCVFQALVLAGLFRFLPSTHGPAATARPSDSLTWFVRLSAFVIAASYLLFFCGMLIGFPDSADGITYHLPKAVAWLQHGDFRLNSNSWQMALAGNSEIGMMLWLGTGWHSLTALSNVIAGLVFAASCHLIASALTRTRGAAIAATVVAVSIPIVEFQTVGTYVDLFGTAFLFAALAVLVIWIRERQTNLLLAFSAMACGLSIGTKPIFWVYGAAFAMATIVGVIRKRKSIAFRIFIVLASLLLPSAFWFLRAAMATGNPVYPLEVKLAGRVIFAGYATQQITPPDYEAQFVQGSSKDWIVYPWVEWRRSTGYLMIPYNAESGLGAAFAAFVPLAFLFGCIRLARREASGLEAYLLATVLVFLVVWCLGLKRVPRFGLPIIGLMCILAAPLFALLQKTAPVASGWLLLLTVSATCAISSFVVFHSMVGQIVERNFSRHEYYGYPNLIDELPRGSRVANWQCGYNNFALAGAHLGNQVIPDFEVPDLLDTEWLRRNRVDYVVHVAEDTTLPPHGLVPVYDGFLQYGPRVRRHWQIWRFEEPTAR